MNYDAIDMEYAIQLWKEAGYPYAKIEDNCLYVSDDWFQKTPALSSKHILIYADGSFSAYEIGWSDDANIAIEFSKEMTTALLQSLKAFAIGK